MQFASFNRLPDLEKFMKNFSHSRTLTVLALLAAPVLAMPGLALAQTATTAPATSQAAAKNTPEGVEAHIAALHSQLQITPAEEGEWSTFAQVMRENTAQMQSAFAARGQTLPTMNAVQDLQSYAQIAQIQSANMQKLTTAFQTLYASFPAAQQKVADEVFRSQKFRH
jgi:glucose dehydrogenase